MIAICCAQYEIAEHVSKNRSMGLFFPYCEVASLFYIRSSPILSNRTHLSLHRRSAGQQTVAFRPSTAQQTPQQFELGTNRALNQTNQLLGDHKPDQLLNQTNY